MIISVAPQPADACATLLCWMDAHEGAAAWAGAAGTILAVLASAAFAVLVPLHMRGLEQRDHARRALKNLRNAGSLILANWTALRALHRQKAVDAGTRLLMGSEMAGFRAVVSEIPRHMLGSDALIALGAFEAQAVGLEMAVDKAIAAGGGGGPDDWFDPIISFIERKRSDLQDMGPVRLSGVWHVDRLRKK